MARIYGVESNKRRTAYEPVALGHCYYSGVSFFLDTLCFLIERRIRLIRT